MKFSSIYLVAFVFLLSYNLFGQTPNWAWAKKEGTTKDESGIKTACDTLGNVYVTGYFYPPTITFGSYTLTNNGITSLDIYIVKYDPNGNVLWAKSFGGAGLDYAFNMCIDNYGNVYIVGTFNSSPITFGSSILTFSGVSTDAFLLKYDSAGNELWAKSVGGTNTEAISGLCIDKQGNVVISGSFGSSIINAGGITLNNVNIGYFDMYLAKFNSVGNVLWAKAFGGSINDYGTSVKTDSLNNIVLAGNFSSSTLVLGTTTLAATTGSMSGYISKLDSSGNFLWAKSYSGTTSGYGSFCAIDPSNNILVAGSYISTNFAIGSSTLTGSGNPSSYLAKFSSAGNFIWVKNSVGTNTVNVNDISINKSGDIYLVGSLLGNYAVFNSDTVKNTSFTGYREGFIVKYDSNGNCTWTNAIGGIYDDDCRSVTCYNGYAYICGYFESTSITFGTTVLNNPIFGNDEIFVAKLDLTTGIHENSISYKYKMHVYPNPFENYATINLNENLHKATIIIYNSLGEVVAELKNIEGNKINIPRGSLPEGMYHIQLTEGNTVIGNSKVIISDF